MPAKKAQLTPQGSGKTPVVLESECTALGCALSDPEHAEIVTTELDKTDFYSGKNQAVFNAMLSLSAEGLTLNPVSVSERAGIVRSEVDDLVDRAKGVTSSQLRTITSDIKRVAMLRSVYTACSNAYNSIRPDSNLEEVLGHLETGIFQSKSTLGASIADGADVMRSVVADFDERYRTGGGPVISTGLKDLDRALIGLRKGKLGIIAARPSMGKTALARTIGRSVLGQGYGVIEFALEMSKEELIERELSFQAQLNLQKILSAKNISPEEYERVLKAASSIDSDKWFIDDTTYAMASMARKARIQAGKMARKGQKVGLVIIDYIQLAGQSDEGREQAIAAVSRGSKFLAKELECTVLALSQLNRNCEYRDDKRPMMSDLRESGAIEQDADWVGFVYREHMYDNSFPPEQAEFILRKQRSGPIGTIHLHYNPKLVTFSDRQLGTGPQIDMPNVNVAEFGS